MSRHRWTACALLALGTTAGSALAQQSGTAPDVAPGAAPAAPAASAAPDAVAAGPVAAAPPPPAAPTAPPRGRIACLVGYHPREFPDSARTATGLVCDAIREQGVDVGPVAYDPGGARAAYVINLDQLGSTFFLRVSYEEPIGVPRKTRRVSLYDLAEAEVAAPRIARSMTGAASVDDTATYDNLVGSEARHREKKNGEFVVGGGIAALSMPSAESYMGPVLNVFGFYETGQWGVGLQGHIGDASMRHDDSAMYGAFSVGARYYFSDQNVTPLVGGGLALSMIRETAQGDYYDRTGSGTSAYVEAGVELFRLHKTHFIATLRVDAPFYALGHVRSYGDYTYSSTSTTTAVPAPPRDGYEMPVLLNVGVGF